MQLNEPQNASPLIKGLKSALKKKIQIENDAFVDR